ncbi:MAG: HD domain-containing protein, partial [Ferrovibrionaceae bacterium]
LWDEFEARQSPDARFAKALDRLQPLLHNYHTAGGTWAEAGIAAAVVLRRMRVMGFGAPALWTYAQGLVADGVARGYLQA